MMMKKNESYSFYNRWLEPMQIFFLDYRYIAKNFDVVGHVFYHCFCARQSIDQKYNPNLFQKMI